VSEEKQDLQDKVAKAVTAINEAGSSVADLRAALKKMGVKFHLPKVKRRKMKMQKDSRRKNRR